MPSTSTVGVLAGSPRSPLPHALRSRRSAAMVLGISLALFANAATAQCQWIPGAGFDLSSSTVSGTEAKAMLVLPNGDLVAAGVFDAIGGVAANHIARWNGTVWSALGTGTNGAVNALALAPNGDIVAGGSFTIAGGAAANYVARWNGANWMPLGAGPGQPVTAVAVLGNGDVVVGHAYTSASVDRWNGTAWSQIGTLGYVGSPIVKAMSTAANGDLLLGGAFTHVNGVVAACIARWSPGAQVWSAIGAGTELNPQPGLNTGAQVNAVVELANGSIVAGGNRLGLSQWDTMATWSGSTWSLSAPFWYAIGGTSALHRLPNNQLLAVGYTATPSPSGSQWSLEVREGAGSVWNTLGSVPVGIMGISTVGAVAKLPNGEVVIGGSFISVDGVPSRYLARRACPLGLATASPYGTGCYDSIATAYEHFSTGAAFDLSQSTVRLDFDGQAFHATALPGAPQFVVPTSPALPLTDDSLSAPIALPFTLPYPGGSTNQILVGSNGFVYLQPATDASAFYGNVSGLRNGAPRLAPMWADQDPGVGTGGGSVHVETIGQAVFVTWWNVQEYSHPALTSTFQLALFAGGDVEYRYLGCAASFPVLTGWSPGGGARDPGSSDASVWAGLVCRPDSLPLLHDAQNRPVLGTTVVMHTSNVPTNSPLGATAIGFVQYNPGLDLGYLGMPSCPQFTSAEVFVMAVPVAEQMWYSWSLPLDLSFLGVHIYTQGVALAPGMNALGFITSNGLDLRLGDV